MLTQQIRRKFLQYFKEKGHSIIASSPVIPHDDPTLLFNNAGMNQFKDVFLGKTKRDYTRATTSQKCIRAGGKHNDLENVGHTTRHLTFFEMLGNFSFGDYFKEDAIKFAWEISTEVFGFEPERIWPTVFRDDDEAFELWKKYVPAERITRFGEKENFWMMGDTGPCGPCSELLYDRGSKFGSAKNPLEDPTGERFLEFWNLVFMQYNRTTAGVMEPLPKPSIDTGVGLERVVSLKMGIDTVFETDILRSLIAQVENVSGHSYSADNKNAPAFRVIADHLRTLSFAIADGAQPSNVDRGYVLRKILRRAVRYGKTLGFEEPFLAKVLPSLIETMGTDYPELKKGQARIAEILTVEEEAFFRTLKRGGNILSQVIENAKKGNKEISGEDAFKLKDTYGLPFEEIVLIAIDDELSVNHQRFKELEEEAKERSRSSQKVTSQVVSDNLYADFVKQHGITEFKGYDALSCHATVVGIVKNGTLVETLERGEEAILLLNHSPFYAEMGGQVGDIGTISNDKMTFNVTDCQSPYKGLHAHSGQLETGSLKLKDHVKAEIDLKRRQAVANNHTATHLLHWALHQVLGEHVKQAGSVVDAERLRFDFSHHKAVTPAEVQAIEELINEKIRDNSPVKGYEISYDEAQKQTDVKQFFGEKYGSKVRVIDIAGYSKELCGGTHIQSLGTIGTLRIIKESSIAAGVRRIEAVTGKAAEQFSRQSEHELHGIAQILKVPTQKIGEKIEKLLEENRTLAQELKTFKKAQMRDQIKTLLAKIEKVNEVPLLAQELQLSSEELKEWSEDLAKELPSGVIVLATKIEDRCQFIVRVSDDLVLKGIKANEIVKGIAPVIEGSGGGKPNSAQAGGKAIHQVTAALEKVKELLHAR